MDDKGEIVSSHDVDDNLSLQIWTKGHTPRLVIFNKAKNSKKLIRLGWVEKRDRKLAVSGKKRGESVNYTIQDFEPTLQRILTEYAVYANFRIKLWRFAVELEKIVNAPEIVTDSGEMNLLTEDKRSSFWIADCTGPDRKAGFFRPFFPVSGAEADAVAGDRLRIAEGNRGVEALLKTGVLRDLAKANPKRWHNPVRVVAAAMLLGFSYCEEDGSDFSDELWGAGAEGGGEDAAAAALTGTVKFTLRDPRLLGLGRKLVAFVRHFDAVPQVEVSNSVDSDKELQEQGFGRTRRLEFGAGTIGDVPYKVTFFEHEDGRIALGCKPEAATQRHKGELVLTLPGDVSRTALKQDTMGGPEDDFYTTTQLAWACQFKEWLDNITPYISNFAGLM